MERGVKVNSKTKQEAKFYLKTEKTIHAAPVNMSTDNLPAVLTFCIVKLGLEALGLFQVLQPMKPAALQNSISSTSLPDYQIYKNKHALGAVSATRLSMLPMQA